MNNCTMVLIAFIALLVAFPHSSEALTLTNNGKTDFRIVLRPNPPATERTAAEELSRHLTAVTGAEFPIKNETQVAPGAKQILVGRSDRSEQVIGNIDWDSMDSDGIVILTKGNSLVLAGTGTRGTIYAVYTFLEDTVGVRWWAPTETFIPSKKTLTVPHLNVKYSPKIKCREAFYRNPNSDPVFASRLKLNGHFNRIPTEYGGHYAILGWCHTFFQFLPPEDYFSKHPEWYSMINGKRTGDRTQLCLSNKEMLKEFTRVVLGEIQKNPSAGIISVSQNDWHGQCQCPECKAIEEEEGSPSGPIIRFVNAVAEEVEKEYPDFLVETLAYTYSRKAPKLVKPRENVIIRLCSIECDFSQPLESDANASFRDDIYDWAKIAHNLYIWNYVTNFSNYIKPHPNMASFADDVRFFEKNNVIGIFQQGDSANVVSEFGKLRAWVLAHLMWNPELDQQKLTDEFLDGYYGAAAPYLKSYLELIQTSQQKTGRNLTCYNRDFSFMGINELNQSTELFEQAEAAVKDDLTLWRRVHSERLPLTHQWLTSYYTEKRLALEQNLPFNGPEDVVAACETFLSECTEYGNRNVTEGGSMDSYATQLRAACEPPPPPPTEFSNLSYADYVDVQDGLFVYNNKGQYSFHAEDPTASNGTAAKMSGGHTVWAVQWPITHDVSGKWRCYVSARHESDNNTGDAYIMGIWDRKNAKGVSRLTIDNGEANKPYKLYDLGVNELSLDLYFYFAPADDGENVDNIYIDRIFMVREQ